jgi:hypothetical protein
MKHAPGWTGLKAHGVFEEYTLDDLEQGRRDMSRRPSESYK